MWRFVVGGLAALCLVTAGIVLFNSRAGSAARLPVQAAQGAAPAGGEALPDSVPEASDKTREQKRFDRYDKDRDGSVTREEYLVSRRKAYAKLDANHDGTLSFDEWAAKTEAKFAGADADKSGAMTAAEFAATAPKRRAPRVRRDCPPTMVAASRDDDG